MALGAPRLRRAAISMALGALQLRANVQDALGARPQVSMALGALRLRRAAISMALGALQLRANSAR
eukprot:16068764-Heterocapsa_arctica.AAC.1